MSTLRLSQHDGCWAIGDITTIRGTTIHTIPTTATTARVGGVATVAAGVEAGAAGAADEHP